MLAKGDSMHARAYGKWDSIMQWLFESGQVARDTHTQSYKVNGLQLNMFGDVSN